MFAFCPHISNEKCGIDSSHKTTGKDMTLLAGLEKKHVQSNEMRYSKPSRENPTAAREYDSCYYEITLDKSVLADYNPKFIHLQVSAKVEMNVFLYGGTSRTEAITPIVPGNEEVAVGTTYKIAAYDGLLLVAYPNRD